VSVKLYTQTSGALVETFNTFDGKLIGQWVAHEDYLALQAALREALDGWERSLGAHSGTLTFADTRITELRAQFLNGS
jgi:hypothetical protein